MLKTTLQYTNLFKQSEAGFLPIHKSLIAKNCWTHFSSRSTIQKQFYKLKLEFFIRARKILKTFYSSQFRTSLLYLHSFGLSVHFFFHRFLRHCPFNSPPPRPTISATFLHEVHKEGEPCIVVSPSSPPMGSHFKF